ncbi:secreted RxLR effector protein 78-like [Vicia villosa]|uniref:secreted RxLR effector protein 78-like n=1 Tax=Vicia villosa TaxID=3911 RepID=UPI00273CBF63|nr:secreted RxLR effector protein 78-like [Vicia villosa]
MLAHELIRGYGRKLISPRCMIQMDIQKAYDTVEWLALNQIMCSLRFPQNFVNWTMTYITSVSYKFSLNGEPSDVLKSKRGLRKGGPISPLLFVLIMEYLYRVLQTLKDASDFIFHPKCDKLKIINICFADDILLFSRADVPSIKLIVNKIRDFTQATGL